MNRFTVAPDQIHPLLKKNILADGFHVAIDLERSHGSFIFDPLGGREILDFYSYFASLPIGHNHPSVTGDEEFLAALKRAAIANPANSDIYAPEFAAFVDTFARLARPEPFQYLFFIAGGALAVENALKAAFDWKVRKNRAAGRAPIGRQILHFREAFHGRSGYTLSLTNTDRVKVEDYPIFNWPRVRNPKLRFPLTDEARQEVALAEREAVHEIEAAFAENPHDVAAIIIEPMQGEGGDNHFRPEFFSELRRLADEHEALLIFDEVQTGLGATGKLWAYEHTGVVPDIIAFGKKTQVCGIMAGPRMDEVEGHVFKKSGRINSTWGGNLVDMVRGSKYLQVIHEEQLVENAARMGAHLLRGLEGLALGHPVIDNVRGKGLFAAFSLPTSEERDQLRTILWEIGLATLPSWPRSIRVRPCLTVNEAEIDAALGLLENGLSRLENRVGVRP